MKLNVKRSDCRFYVDEENRKVVCVIPHTKDLILDYICDASFFPMLNFNRRLIEEMVMPASFTGIATCHESDTFDVETGKLIAYNKAKNKLNISFFKRANKFVNHCDARLNLFADELNALGMRVSDNVDRCEKEIAERLNK